MSVYKRGVPAGSPCHYCDDPATTWDHIWPEKLGGPPRLWNLVPACGPCNEAKGHTLPTCRCEQCAATPGRMLEARWAS